MKINMRILLNDAPGSLVKAIEPISSKKGNIQSIVHFPNLKENNQIPVEITFEIKDISSLEDIKAALINQNIKISEINIEGRKYYKKIARTIIMIGHVIDRNILDTIDRINKVGMVYDLKVIMKSPEAVSTCMLKIECDEDGVELLEQELNKICSEKDFLLISDLN